MIQFQEGHLSFRSQNCLQVNFHQTSAQTVLLSSQHDLN